MGKRKWQVAVKILSNGNNEADDDEKFAYATMEDVIEDDKFLDKLIEFKK